MGVEWFWKVSKSSCLFFRIDTLRSNQTVIAWLDANIVACKSQPGQQSQIPPVANYFAFGNASACGGSMARTCT